ncbi:DUF4190 domain-containing protein [Streptomyces kaniharaensis]|uniref:DUF4190 domain-containing protein n=1 Tax=Streptomyces kaniharaensis TaxID=212423 RepID=A0A6N7KZR3_9ACTN|nr:DUF4190 domain-containing protein [Streptomyces kaniharaensis]MQS16891.1 DUF4190 domain-containing protein [Streptomyces kaniharaensis]
MSRPIDDPSAAQPTPPTSDAGLSAPPGDPATTDRASSEQPAIEQPAAQAVLPGYPQPPQAPGPYTAGPYGPGPHGWPPHAVPQPKAKASGMAITSFVLGLLGFVPPLSLVSIGLAISAFRRIFRRRQGGFGFAVAGLVLACSWTMVAVTVGGLVAYGLHDLTSGPARGADGHPVAAGRAGLWYLKAGDCALDDLSTHHADPSHFRVVPCDQPHRLEVYASATIPGGDSYPGVASAQKSARGLCQARTDSTAVPKGGSIGYFYPSKARWVLADDRDALCVFTSATPWSGTVKPGNGPKASTPV